MEVRFAMHPSQFKALTTEQIRKEFLIENLFEYGKINMVYTHVDRVIVGSAVPTVEALVLEDGSQIGAQYFLERREIGIINIGSRGYVIADGQKFELDKKDGLYVGMSLKNLNLGAMTLQILPSSILFQHLLINSIQQKRLILSKLRQLILVRFLNQTKEQSTNTSIQTGLKAVSL